MKRYVLDACAVIAVLNDESGCDTVLKLVHDEVLDISMHKLNLLEVYYDVYRRRDIATAVRVLQKIQRSPIRIVSEITDAVFAEAGRLKATYKISLADAVALAEASVSRGLLVTSDHHEFDTIESTENIEFMWIR